MLDHEELMTNKALFYESIYTPLSQAIKILEERQKDPKIKEKVLNALKGNIPEPLRREGKHAVQFRQIATPNIDTQWFLELTKDNGLSPVFFEYHDDKFTSNNHFKHSLGQLRLHKNLNKKGNFIEEKITVVDFAKHDGKKIKEVVTIWSEPIVDLHRRLFKVCGYPEESSVFYDASEWLKNNGSDASGYYENFLLLFMCHGVLFENFLFDESEGEFTRNVFIPAFEKVSILIGVKPLIVPIPPMDYQEDTHWVSYDPMIKNYIQINQK